MFHTVVNKGEQIPDLNSLSAIFMKDSRTVHTIG